MGGPRLPYDKRQEHLEARRAGEGEVGEVGTFKNRVGSPVRVVELQPVTPGADG